jgi:hypothetical protein
VVNITPRPLYPREIPGTHCTGGWVGPRAGLDVCEKSRPHQRNLVPTEKEAAWGERLYGCSLNEENLLPKQGFERQFLGRAGRNLIAVSTEISQLQFW